jgi:lipid-A-disaccharide synthase-like uncharacterized protein
MHNDKPRVRRLFLFSRKYFNTTDMEFLNAVLVEISGHKLGYSQTRVFYPHFSVLQNAINEKTSLFPRAFWYVFLKPE